MSNDTIKLLNLEDINVDFEKSDVVKINNVLYCNIVLTTVNEHCPECGSTDYFSNYNKISYIQIPFIEEN